MGICKNFIIFSLVLFFLTSGVNADKGIIIQTPELNNGLEINYPKIFHIPQGEDATFRTIPVNKSNGVALDDSQANCTFYLTNYNGEYIYEGEMDHDSISFLINISGSNFSRTGYYAYGIHCVTVDGSLGGFASISFFVTPSGQIPDSGESLLYAVLLTYVFLMFFGCFYFGLKLPFKNHRDYSGKIVGIEWKKYLKVTLLTISYALFMWFVNLAFALSNNYSFLTQYTHYTEIIFRVANSFSYVVFVFAFIFMMVLMWRDLQLRKILKMGFSAEQM